MAAGLGGVETSTRTPAPIQATRAAALPLTLLPLHLKATCSAAVSRLLPPTHVSCAAAVTHCMPCSLFRPTFGIRDAVWC